MIKLNDLHEYNNKKGIIFLITNTFNGKRFIGASANNITNELNGILESEEGVLLAGAIAKYNKSAFIVEILEENKPEGVLKGFVNYYIMKYKTLLSDGGYNKIVVKADKSKEIEPKYYLIKDGKLQFFYNQTEMAETLGIAKITLSKMVNGKRRNTKCEELGVYIDGQCVSAEYIGEKVCKDTKSKERYCEGVERVKAENLKKINDADLSEWIGKELMSKEKAIIASQLALTDVKGNKGTWNTAKKYIQLCGKYEVKEKIARICGDRVRYSVITIK